MSKQHERVSHACSFAALKLGTKGGTFTRIRGTTDNFEETFLLPVLRKMVLETSLGMSYTGPRKTET